MCIPSTSIQLTVKSVANVSTACQSGLVYLKVGASETGLTAVGEYGVIAAFSITAKVKPCWICLNLI